MQLPEEKKKVQKFHFQSRASAGWKPKVFAGVERMMDLAFSGEVEEFSKAFDEESKIKPDILNTQDDRHGNVPLHIASSKGNIDLIAFLIRKRASVNVQDFYGNTPLLYAIDKKQTAAAQYLIKNGANIVTADFRGNTPLHMAAGQNSMEMVNILLARGANPEELNHANEKPAHKTSFPAIADIINRAAERKKNGVDDAKMTVNWMGFGIGMGVGLGIALARQQQIFHEQNMLYEERKRKEEEAIRQAKIEEAKHALAMKKAAAAKKFLMK